MYRDLTKRDRKSDLDALPHVTSASMQDRINQRGVGGWLGSLWPMDVIGTGGRVIPKCANDF